MDEVTERLLELYHAATRVLTEVRSGREAFERLAPLAGGLLGWESAAFWLPVDAGELQPVLYWQPDDPHPPSHEFVTAVWTGEIVGWRSGAGGRCIGVAFPLLSGSGPVGLVEARVDKAQPPTDAEMDTLSSIGRQVAEVVERARGEKALRDREARLAGILDAAIDAIITLDHAGRITGFNPAAERTFGLTAAEVMGRELAEVAVPPAMRERHRSGFARCAATGEGALLGRRLELTAMRGDGAEFPAELTITRLEREGRPAFAGHVRDISERQALLSDLRESRSRVMEVADAERRRIERDLHDGAQQRLLAAAMNLRFGTDQVADGDATVGLDVLREASAELERATAELRGLARGLHPALLTERGLGVALEGVARRAPLPVRLEVEDGPRLPAAVEAAAYYTVTEALTNVARYAEAVRASVTVRRGAEGLEVTVADDGRGGATVGGGSGLLGLIDRLAALEGTLEVESPPGGGTRVVARIPLAG